jgi:hypothetical protein
VIFGLLNGEADDLDAAVLRAEVDAAVGVDVVRVVDGLFGEGADDADEQHIKGFDAVGRLGDELDAFDEQNIRRFDDVARQRYLFEFARHGAGGRRSRRRQGHRRSRRHKRGAASRGQQGGDQEQVRSADGLVARLHE